MLRSAAGRLLLVSFIFITWNVCHGQTMCRYVYEPDTSLITGLCQTVVYTPDSASSCYWFQTDRNDQDRRVPYVGVLQVVPTPGSQGFAALCLFERRITGFSPDSSFVVSFNNNFSTTVDTERFEEPTVKTSKDGTPPLPPPSTTTTKSTTATTGTSNNATGVEGSDNREGRQLNTKQPEPDSPTTPTDSSDDGGSNTGATKSATKDTVLVVLGCVAAVAVPGFLLSLVLRLRSNLQRQKSAGHTTEPEQDEQQQKVQVTSESIRHIPILALRRSDYPNTFLGIANPSSNSDESNDVAMTTSQRQRRQSFPSKPEKAVRFEEEPARGVQSRRMYLPDVHSFVHSREREERTDSENSDLSCTSDIWTTHDSQNVISKGERHLLY